MAWTMGTGLSVLSYASTVPVIYPKAENHRSLETDYPVRLLKLALEKTEASPKVLPTFKALPKNRALYQLKEGSGVDVVWARTTTQREKDFRAIKIPIFKGLSGWKVPLVNKQRDLDLSHVKTVAQLQRYSVIQGSHWSGRQVFEANDIVVHHAYEQRSLFEMLSRNRGDLLFQSVIDTWSYQENHRHHNIEMEQHLTVRFPEAIYFFVHPENEALAKLIETGLKASISDGSFDALFNELVTPYIERCQLESRNVVELENPGFPRAQSALNERFWFYP